MRKGVILLSGILALGAFLLLYPIWVLICTKNDQVIFLRVVKPGDTFQLAYLHSVAWSDVRDFFRIDAEYRLVLTETLFQGQGAGLPYGVSPGEQWVREGDWFRITGMRRVVPSIDWRIQAEWKNRFRFQNAPEVDVSAQVGNGLIHIQTEKVRLIYWLGFYLHRLIQSK